MKRKPNSKPEPVQPPETPPVTERAVPAQQDNPWRDRLWLVVWTLMFFGAVTIITGRATLVGMAAALVLTVRKSSPAILAERFSVPVIGFLAFALMTFLAAIYSPFEESAVTVCYIALSAVSVAMVTLLRCRKEHVPMMLWGVMGISALMSLMAVDLASFAKLSQGFMSLISVFGVIVEMESGVASRLDGMFNNANVGASLSALGMLVGLYKIQEEPKRGTRFAAALLLGVNAVYFWMSLSRGAVLCFGVSLAVYLLVIGKGRRISLFLLMVECVAATVALSALATPYLGSPSLLPDLMALLCGAVIFLLNEFLTRPVSNALEGKGRLIAIVSGAVAVCCVAAVILALNLTGPYTFVELGAIYRSVPLKPGEYTVTGQWDEGLRMEVYVEADRYALLMDKGEWKEYGAMEQGMTVTIPGGARYVKLCIAGVAGQTVDQISFSDGTKVKLDYLLLPATLEDRLQDNLLTSSSMLLRVQYMVDALKIWATSPIYGRGLGSTEGLYTSVQPLFYMSMFVHNHLLQYMADMGLLGLASFLMIALGIAWLLVRRLRKGQDPLAAMFVACLVMMNLHGMMELIFSVRGYLVVAMTLMAIMTVAYGEPLLIKGEKGVRRASVLAAVTCWVMLVVFSGMLISYRMVQKVSREYEPTDFTEFMSTMERFIARDAFCNEYHKLFYILNGNGKSQYQYNVDRYAASLRRGGTYTYCAGVAEYYYLPKGELGEMFACSREAISQKASDKDSWNFQLNFYRNTVLPALSAKHMGSYLQGVLDTKNYLAEYSVGRLEEIELTEENQAFLREVEQVWKEGVSGEEARERLMAFTETKDAG